MKNLADFIGPLPTRQSFAWLNMSVVINSYMIRAFPRGRFLSPGFSPPPEEGEKVGSVQHTSKTDHCRIRAALPTLPKLLELLEILVTTYM